MHYNESEAEKATMVPIHQNQVKIVIAGYFGFHNIGDEAILSCMINRIRSDFPDVSIAVLSGDTQYTRTAYNVEAIDRADFAQISRIIEECDLVLLGGGGLFQEHYPIRVSDVFDHPKSSMSYYAAIPILTKLRHKPLIFYSQGIGPLFSVESRSVVAFASMLADSISVRDNDSKALLEEIGIPEGKITLSFDPAIDLVPAPENTVKNLLEEVKIPSDKNIICICPRAWVDKTVEKKYVDALTVAIDKLLEHEDKIALFIPFHMDAASGDSAICEKVISAINKKDKCYTLYGHHSPEEIGGVLSKASLVIGMRYHSIIFSLLSGIPFVALSYSPKVRSLASELGQDAYCIDIGVASGNILYEKIIDALNNKDKIRSDLTALRASMKKRSEASITLITKCLNNMLPDTGSIDQTKLLSAEVREQRDRLNYYKGIVQDKDTLIQKLESEHCKINSRLEEKSNELKVMEANLSQLNQKLGFLRSSLNDSYTEIDRLNEVVRQRESSLSWQLSQYYGKYFSQTSPLTRSLTYLLGKILKRKRRRISVTPNVQKTDTEPTGSPSVVDGLIKFLDDNKDKEICLIFSGTKFVENEGQRTLRLAQSFSRKGFAVIFAGWRWNEQEPIECGQVYNSIFQIPIDLLLKNQSAILGYPGAHRKILLIQFPHPSTFEILSLANSYGWISIYDVLDDWDSFQKVGQAVWYDKYIEGYVIHNSDITTAVSPGLLEKIENDFKPCVSKVVPNGVSTDAIGNKSNFKMPATVPRGSITIGYFGHLTPAWFDWDLVTRAAKRNPGWKFHIIGYGKPDNIVLPENVLFLGKVIPQKLAEYSLNWDVAIIPFKQTELSKSVDPIKIYEYLYLGVPVVVTGIYHVNKYPYVWIARSLTEFEESIVNASGVKLDRDIVEKFVSENTWEKRVDELIELVGNVNRTSPLKGV